MKDPGSDIASVFCKGVLFLATLLLGLQLAGQAPFSKTYPGFGFGSATIAPDSGLVLSSGNSLLRVDRNGTPIWVQEYSNSEDTSFLSINDVAWIGDSSFIFVGRSLINSSNQMCHQVVNASGVPVWGGVQGFFNADQLTVAERAPDGTVVVGGHRWGLSITYGYAVRIGDAEDTYATPLISYPDNSPPVANIVRVLPTNDGGFIGLGIDGMLLIGFKLNASGIFEWSRSLPIGGPDILNIQAVEGDAGSTYIASGTLSGLFHLFMLDQNGEVVWSKEFQMPGSDSPYGMVRFANGDIWINGQNWLMACSGEGDVLWAHTLHDTAWDMVATPEGNGVYLVGGGLWPGQAGSDGWLMRTDIYGQAPNCIDSIIVPIVTTSTLPAATYPPPEPSDLFNPFPLNVTPTPLPAIISDCIFSSVPFENLDGSILHVYPIPFSHQLIMELDMIHDRIELFDVQGAVRFAMDTNEERSLVLSRGDLASGIYLLRVLYKGNTVAVHRVIAD